VLERWLLEVIEARDDSEKLDIVTFVGDRSIDDEEIDAYLGHELVRNYVSPGELAAVFDDLGVPQVAEHLRTNKFPNVDRVRRGEFGEALTGTLLRRVQRWCVPIRSCDTSSSPTNPYKASMCSRSGFGPARPSSPSPRSRLGLPGTALRDLLATVLGPPGCQ
jgi:hypothetical protein